MKNASFLHRLPTVAIVSLGMTTASEVLAAPPAPAYQFRVVASGLYRPTGIAVQGSHTLFFTQVPTPGIGAAKGGSNSVSQLALCSGKVDVLHIGEPEPVNITLGSDNDLYWTCKSAGVILKQDDDGVTTVLLKDLAKPSGITVDRCGTVYYTLVPTLGIPGAAGGMNSVNFAIGNQTYPLHMGEPEPTDIVVSRDGDLYWTCKSAGVILTRSGSTGELSPLLDELDKPTGIAIDADGRNLYWTEVPTPGVAGKDGGKNNVWQYDLKACKKTLIHSGDPEPTDVAVARNGNIYWTCSSAGVIVEAKRKPSRR